MGKKKGWTVFTGGAGARKPRLADVLIEDVDSDRALEIIRKVVDYYKENAKKHERIGAMMERIGMDALKTTVLS